MKNVIIAAAIAVTSLVAFAPASYADTIVVKTSDHGMMHRHWHPRHHRCTVRTVKTWHHGHRVVKQTRVCG